MPHLVQMDKRYSKKGLQIIGAEVQGSSKVDIDKITKEHKIQFPITNGVSGPSTGSGIPHAVVFDAAGKLVFSGHPSDKNFDKSIKSALKEIKKTDDGRSSSLPEKAKPMIEKRTWTNEDGKKIVAAVLEVEATDVLFKLSNGKKVNYSIAKLSAEDQELIKKAAAEKSEKAE